MKTRWALSVVMFLFSTLLAGCWNSREIKELAIVMAIGVDKVPETSEYKVSFQLVNPGVVATGMTGGGGGMTAAPVNIKSATGKTIFEAIRKASQNAPRQLFFAHSQMLIIGEAAARDGIRDLFDFFERSHESRLNTTVLVARGAKAEDVIRILTPLDKIPANGIASRLKSTSNVWSESMKTEVDQVIRSLTSAGEPMISGISIMGDPQDGADKSNVEQAKLATDMAIKGIALFKDGKLKRWVDGDAARGISWIKDEMKSTIVDLDCNGDKDAVAIEVVRSYTKMNADILGGQPAIHIAIREEGTVGEVRCSMDISKPEQIEKLEQKWAAETKKQVMEAVKVAQEEKSDIFQFGDAVNRADPKLWKSLREDWANTFAETKVDVTVEALIRRSGMRLKPYLTKDTKEES